MHYYIVYFIFEYILLITLYYLFIIVMSYFTICGCIAIAGFGTPFSWFICPMCKPRGLVATAVPTEPGFAIIWFWLTGIWFVTGICAGSWPSWPAKELCCPKAPTFDICCLYGMECWGYTPAEMHKIITWWLNNKNNNQIMMIRAWFCGHYGYLIAQSNVLLISILY